MTSVRQQLASGAVWMVGFRMGERVLGLVSTLILARLLVPHDFGVVAMAMSFVALLELLTAFGFDVVLIQKAGNDRSQWDTAWTFGVIFGILLAAIMVASAGWVASFYQTPELEDILRVLALGCLVQGFCNVGVVAFRKDMRFDKEFWFMFSRKAASFAVTIPAAWILKSFWALIIGQMVSRIVELVLSYSMHPYRPRASFSAARDLLGYSRWLVAGNVATYFRERSSDWALGRFSGAHALGSYNVGAEIAALPSTELLAPVNRALVPAYAKIVQAGGDLRSEYMDVLAMMSLVGVPAVLGLGALAPVLVPVALGAQWKDMIPVLMILSLGGIGKVITGNLYPACFALNRPDLTFKVSITSAVLVLAGMWVFVPKYGLMGAALVSLGVNLFVLPWAMFLVMRLMRGSIREIITAVWRPLLAGGVMSWMVLSYALRSSRAVDPTAANLLVGVILGVVVYTGIVLLLWLMAGKPQSGETMLWRKVEPQLTAFWRRWAQYPPRGP